MGENHGVGCLDEAALYPIDRSADTHVFCRGSSCTADGVRYVTGVSTAE